jgi:MoaA/NifB/PqqE/SkfB family radical SAM enzyme
MNKHAPDDVMIKKVYLELTQRCNLNCTSCFRQNWDFPQTQMSEEVFLRCMEGLKSTSSLEEIVLGGIGERRFTQSLWNG